MSPPRKRSLVLCFGLAGVVVLLTAAPAVAQPCRWIDDRGGVHLTNSPNAVPEAYREQCRRPRSESPSPVPPPSAPTATPSPIQAPASIPEVLSRVMTNLSAGYEKRLGGRVVRSELVPFNSNIAGTQKWELAMDIAGQRGVLTKVLAEFPPGWVLMLTVGGTAEAFDGLARRILDTLRAKPKDADCYWPVFRSMMRAAGRDGSGSDTERHFRASAAEGKPEELLISSPVSSFVFSNGALPVCYSYAIPGAWKPGREPSMYLSQDGNTEVGILFLDR